MIKLSHHFSFTSDQSINAVKTCIACAIGLVIAKGFHIEMGQWILMSIMVVMASQVHLGGARQKAYLRVLGTLAGAVVGGIALYFFAHSQIMTSVILLIACLMFAYIAGGENGVPGTLGGATVIMILMNDPPNPRVIYMRPLEIILGIMIALVVSRFVFPIHATKRLIDNFVVSLEALKKLYEHIQDFQGSVDDAAQISPRAEEKLLNLFLAQRKLLDEARSESQGKKLHLKLKNMLKAERRLYRSILLMNYALYSNPRSTTIIKALASYQNLNAEVIQGLQMLSSKMQQHDSNLVVCGDFEVLTALTNDIQKIAADHPFEVELNVEAFLVATQFLLHELKELTLAVNELSAA
ncbi:MAG: yeeA [Gammaproteobacteria bacterium]|jgi:uncharacterized membrane protein YccC|nr:yeeA [Gammaproteobacteria bacterium]